MGIILAGLWDIPIFFPRHAPTLGEEVFSEK